VPGTGAEILGPVFGVDAALDGVAGEMHVVLGEAQRFAFGDRDLFGDQVEPADRLGDRMLDLDARVHLEEVEGVALAVDEQFDGAQPAVFEVPGEGDGGLVHRGPQPVVQVGGRRFFDQLLVAALDRAVARA